jgi:hypothetical protein
MNANVLARRPALPRADTVIDAPRLQQIEQRPSHGKNLHARFLRPNRQAVNRPQPEGRWS